MAPPAMIGEGGRTTPLRRLERRLPAIAVDVAWALLSSVWIGVCAAAPEFIWRGFTVALAHVSRADLVSILLIGLILAFFVEPVLERARGLLRPTRHPAASHGRPRRALVTAALSFLFAVITVCLHDAMLAFIASRSTGEGEAFTGLTTAIALTAEWAVIPFALALAWHSARSRWLALPAGLAAAVFCCGAGWLFSWTPQAAISTAIPCVLILFFGFRALKAEPRQQAVGRCVRVVVIVSAAWLIVAHLLDFIARLAHAQSLELYGVSDLLIDIRFYIGWALGLVLVPLPFGRPAREPAAVSGGPPS